MERKAIVIGAGVGGTSAAAFLAKDGFDVTVLEKNGFAGGVCSSIEANGYRFERGPMFLMLLETYEKIFEELGEKMSDHMEVLHASGVRIHLADGSVLQTSGNLVELFELFERFEGKNFSISKALRFLDECQTYHDLLSSLLVNCGNQIRLSDTIPLIKRFKWSVFQSIRSRLMKYFTSETLIYAYSALNAFSFGMSPDVSVSLFNSLSAAYGLEKIHHPKHGMASVPKAIEKIAVNKFGAKFVYNKSVASINVNENNEATGVTLTNGEIMNADVVVCNANTVYAYNKLLPKTQYATKLANNGVQSDCTIQFLWSLNTRVEQLTFFQAFTPEDLTCSFKPYGHPDYTHKKIFTLFLPNRIDETAAPKNADSVSVFYSFGQVDNVKEHNFKEVIALIRKYVIETIEKRLNIKNFESFIENEIIIEPNDWSEQFNCWNGAPLGFAMIASQLFLFRPSNRSHLFKRLYFVGSSTNPGCGVNTCLYSGKFAANMVKNDLSGNNTFLGVQNLIAFGFGIVLLLVLFYNFFQ